MVHIITNAPLTARDKREPSQLTLQRVQHARGQAIQIMFKTRHVIKQHAKGWVYVCHGQKSNTVETQPQQTGRILVAAEVGVTDKMAKPS